MLSNDSSNSVDLMLYDPKKALIKMSIPLIISLLITSFSVLAPMLLQVLDFSHQYL